MSGLKNSRSSLLRKLQKQLQESAAIEFIHRLEFLIKEGVTLEILEADIAGHAEVSRFIANKALQHLNGRFNDGSLKLSYRPSRTIKNRRVFRFEVIIQNK